MTLMVFVQVSYLNFERQRLPDELMKAEMLKQTGIDIDRQDIEVQVWIITSTPKFLYYSYFWWIHLLHDINPFDIHFTLPVVYLLNFLWLLCDLLKTEGVYNQRLQNLAITLDKVSFYVDYLLLDVLLINEGTHTHIYICMHMHVCMDVCMYGWMYVCITFLNFCTLWSNVLCTF